MSQLTNIPLQDNYKSTLSQAWDGNVGTIYVNTTPSFTFPSGVKTYICVDPGKTNMQVARISAYDATLKTITVDNITLDKGNGVAYTAQTHTVGSVIEISDNYQFREDILTALNTKVNTNSADTDTGKFADATARDAYFTSPVNGNSAYLIAEGKRTDYVGGAWVDRATGSTPNASATVAGKVEKATSGEVTAGTSTGGTGAELFVGPAELKTVTDGLTVSINNLSRFGNGSDGAIGAGALTITGSNNTYIVKQYTTFAPGANTVTITPTNCILHIKVQGDCNLTGTTFAFNGKGGTAGTAGTGGSGATVNGGNGGDGIATLFRNYGGAGGGNTNTVAQGYVVNAYAGILAGCGSGGGGGQFDQDTAGSAGNGGAGGGCLILEIGGNLTFSGTTMNFQGSNGSNAVSSQAGGGGGAGGTIFIVYKGTLSGSPTTNVAGGTGGTGSTYTGGQGGNSVITTGASPSGGNGGAGAAGVYYIQQI